MLFRRKNKSSVVSPTVQEHRETLERLETVARVASCIRDDCAKCWAHATCVRRRAKEHTYN